MIEVKTCTACGAPLTGKAAKYCSQCGTETAVSNGTPVAVLPNRRPLNRMLVALLWVALIGTSSSLFFLTLGDFRQPGSNNLDAGKALFGLVLWCYLIAKVRRLPRAWIYAVAGVGLAFVIICAALLASERWH